MIDRPDLHFFLTNSYKKKLITLFRNGTIIILEMTMTDNNVIDCILSVEY